jgi:hypothetical protein
MTGRSIQPPWTNSSLFGGEFIYQPKSDEIVLKNGRRYQRPQSLPVNSLTNASYDGPLPIDRTGSGNYMLDPGRSRAFSAPESHGDRLPNDVTSFQLPLLPSTTPRQVPRSLDRAALQSTPIVANSKTTGGQTTPDANRTLGQKGPAQLPRSPTTVYYAKQPSQRQRGEPAKRPDASSRKVATSDADFLSKALPTFAVRKRSPDDVGKIILIIRSGSTAGSSLTPFWAQGIDVPSTGETVFAQTDRYVIIHPGSPSDPHFVALPIRTYGGRGVAAPRVIKSHHCIIFSNPAAREPTRQEEPTRGDDGMRRPPIRVVLNNPTDSLDPMCRVHLMGATAISNNERIRDFGRVSNESEVDLLSHFWNTWSRTRPLPTLTTSRTPLSRPPFPGSLASRQLAPRAVEEEDDDDDDDDEEDDGGEGSVDDEDEEEEEASGSEDE